MQEKIKVLVVDDDRRMVRTICDILTVHGYLTREAHSADEAVEKVNDYRFDSVLMDIRMPGTDGLTALQLIKACQPDLPVVLMSAYATEDQAAEANAQGAYAVLVKPFDVQMVLSFLALLRKEESVLVVDDDPAFCSSLADILEARGFSVESEADPGKVLERMETGYKLVVVVNVKLGDVNGLDVLKAIRDKYPTKPVLLVTGYGEGTADAVKKGMQIGAYTCLYKPFASETLIETIKEIRRKKLSAVLGEPFEQREAKTESWAKRQSLLSMTIPTPERPSRTS